MSFWRLLVTGELGSPAGHLSAPLYRSFSQSPTFTLWLDASGDAMGGYFLGPELGSGAWWRFEFDVDVRARLHATVRDWNDLSINVLEPLAIVVTAWNFVTQSDARPSYARDTVLMRRGQHVRRSMGIQVPRRERTPIRGAYAPATVSGGRQRLVF